MHSFDRPFFKKLANNDTGAAPGHQSGVVITKDIDKYFPLLPITTTAPSCELTAALFVGSHHLGIVKTRYQYQTWSGTRPPERRITGNLSGLLGAAVGGDILIFERSLADDKFYRLSLHKAGTAEFIHYSHRVGTRKRGAVDTEDSPVSEIEISQAEQSQFNREHGTFNLFDNAAALKETRSVRVARSQAFKRILLPIYGHRCAVCGLGHFGAGDLVEVEAAHIVPRSLKGADDSRNGFVLCRSHHWAFDNGLFGVDSDRKILVRPSTLADPRNSHLVPFHGNSIASPTVAALTPAGEAWAWHRKYVVGI